MVPKRVRHTPVSTRFSYSIAWMKAGYRSCAMVKIIQPLPIPLGMVSINHTIACDIAALCNQLLTNAHGFDRVCTTPQRH